MVPLIKMFSHAKSNDERIASANALWMLLFDVDNQELFKQIDGAYETILAHAVSHFFPCCCFIFA